MKIAVIGGLGQVGSAIALEYLQQGHEVDICDPGYYDYDHKYAFDKLKGWTHSNHPIAYDQEQSYDFIIVACFDYNIVELYSEGVWYTIDKLMTFDERHILISDWRCSLDSESRLAKLEQSILKENGKVIRFGDVFGGWTRIRFDTLINRLIFELWAKQQYIASDDCCHWLPYTCIISIGRKVREIIELNREKYFVEEIYDGVERFVEIVLRVRKLFEQKYEYDTFNITGSDVPSPLKGWSVSNSNYTELPWTSYIPTAQGKKDIVIAQAMEMMEMFDQHPDKSEFMRIEGYPTIMMEQQQSAEARIKKFGTILI